jgi:tRNA nucleotidyltransferase (CCA-adding enzyme)
MKVYCVGGSVRDELLGLPVKDRDFVVVGSTPEEMERLGFRPVGREFPVFLHPHTHEEHALARTERKTARGYKGFTVHAAPEVTLEDDLARRDLTINAIAKDEAGNIIDPFGGVADLRARILRHVSPAFSEDPVRVLRAARFAARFGFSIAPETLALMREMVENGEVDALTPERVWQELARGLMEHTPSRMFLALRECGALAKILPELDRLFGVPQPSQHHPEVDTGVHVMLVIDFAAARNAPLPVRFAALTHDVGKGETPPAEWPRHIGHEERGVKLVQELSRRLKAPSECSELAILAVRFHGTIHRALELKAATIMKLLSRTDALRKPERFEQLLMACACDYLGRAGLEHRGYPQALHLWRALQAAKAVDAGAIAKTSEGPIQIQNRVHAARVNAVRTALKHAAI